MSNTEKHNPLSHPDVRMDPDPTRIMRRPDFSSYQLEAAGPAVEEPKPHVNEYTDDVTAEIPRAELDRELADYAHRRRAAAEKIVGTNILAGAVEVIKGEGKIRIGYAAEARDPLSENSEDHAMYDRRLGIFGVFDGAGGVQNGSEAAAAAAKSFHASLEVLVSQPEYSIADMEAELGQYMQVANQKVIEAQGMTTASVGVIVSQGDERYVVFAHTGDTMIGVYQQDEAGDMKLRWLTEEQTMTAELRKKYAEAGHDPMGILDTNSNVVTSSLGISQRGNPALDPKKIQTGSFKLKPGSRIVALTDGVLGDKDYEKLSDEEIAVCLDGPDLSTQAQALIDKSKKADDKTALVIEPVF